METFVKIVNGFQLFSIFAKSSRGGFANFPLRKEDTSKLDKTTDLVDSMITSQKHNCFYLYYYTLGLFPLLTDTKMTI